MKINRLFLNEIRPTIKNEEIVFPKEKYAKDSVLKDILWCKVSILAFLARDRVRVKFVIQTKVELLSCYSLKPFGKLIKVKDYIDFVDSKEKEDDSSFYEPGNEIDLDDYIYGLIYSEIPMNPHRAGEKLPSGCRKESETNTEDHSSPFDDIEL